MVKPSSTNKLTPLAYLDSSLPKNTTASATPSAFSLTPLRLPVLSIIASNVSTSTPNKLVVSGVANPVR
ncbi:hypothetical protein OPV22_000971 [Ensete ventricosum]|uniref:Uncharacterized protein n=1 Tax=Ensete ventricosum TaxID=4639 RepID=A0AAV8RP68_ENSVE|nr:hypothetical protein OPV22_000971 [Ensete ventricosum]